jgi:hypothetical protein
VNNFVNSVNKWCKWLKSHLAGQLLTGFLFDNLLLGNS